MPNASSTLGSVKTHFACRIFTVVAGLLPLVCRANRFDFTRGGLRRDPAFLLRALFLAASQREKREMSSMLEDTIEDDGR